MFVKSLSFVALLLVLQPACFPAEPEAITIDARKARPLTPGIFSTATVWDLGGVRPEDPTLVNLMRTIRSPVLRLPAGNTLNLWDWNAGAVRTAEQLRQFNADPNSSMAAGPVKGRARYFETMAGPMKAERWVQLAKEGGSEPLWGINVSTSSPEETRQFLLHLKEAGLPAGKFELGNELYLSHWKREIPTVQDYLSKAKAHAREIRSVFPNARIAVCANANDDRVNGPLVKSAPDRFKPAPLNEWNAALSRETFYDAVTVHLYFKSEELQNLAKITADEYARWAIVRGSAFSVGEILDWPRRVFPGKEVWVTEWSLNNNTYKNSHKDQNYRFLSEHTMLSGLFTACFLLNAASAPSSVTVANYWQLNGGNEFGLISGEPPKQRPAYHVFRMLSPVIHECDRIAALTVAQAPRVRGPGRFEVMEAPLITGFVFFRGNEPRYLAFLNFTGEKFPVHIALNQPAKLEYLTGAELLPSWNNPDNPGPGEWAPKYEMRQADIKLPGLTLERYSFSVVSLG
jgi:hypothetical protein